MRALRATGLQSQVQECPKTASKEICRPGLPRERQSGLLLVSISRIDPGIWRHPTRDVSNALSLSIPCSIGYKGSLNSLFARRWLTAQNDPFVERNLPTPPVLACRNHPTIGQLLSHKRKTFDSSPQPTSVSMDNATHFTLLRFNRPRRKQDLLRSHPNITLLTRDHNCGNLRCLVCLRLRKPAFLASTRNHTTHPVEAGLHCMTVDVVYVMTCCRCGKQYVVETARTM